MTKHSTPELPLGLYADRSYLALVVRTGYKLAYYITIDYPMRLHHMPIEKFRMSFPRTLSQYTSECAARRFLATQQAGTLTTEARHALEALSGYDLLQ